MCVRLGRSCIWGRSVLGACVRLVLRVFPARRSELSLCALDRAASESGRVSVWIDEGSNILRRCFAGKDRLFLFARVSARAGVFRCSFACLISYAFRRSSYRRCHMYAQTPSGKAECRRFDRLIGAVGESKNGYVWAKHRSARENVGGLAFSALCRSAILASAGIGERIVRFCVFHREQYGKIDRNQAILSLNMRG